MAEKKNVVTYSGLKKIEEELQNLKVNKRREIAAKIKEAREQGDLSENAEYDAAKDEQRDIEARIEQLEAMLKNIEVVDESCEEAKLSKIRDIPISEMPSLKKCPLHTAYLRCLQNHI